MSKQSLEILRKHLSTSSTGPNISDAVGTFKVSDMKIGDTAKIRFIPNPSDPENIFWVNQSFINISFSGTTAKPHQPVSGRIQPTPAIIDINRGLWKTNEDIARKFYPRKSYVAQAIVKSDPTGAGLEGTLVKITISPQLYKVIIGVIMDDSLEALPCDVNRGLDFNIIKTQQGEFANYSSSSFARKESALTPSELQLALSAPGLETYAQPELTELEQEHLLAAYTAAISGDEFDTSWSTVKVYPARA